MAKTKLTEEKELKKILDGEIVWPTSIVPMVQYRRTHDDCDGQRGQCISVIFGPDGDAHCSQGIENGNEINNSEELYEIGVLFPINFLRFRNFRGGGRSLRVYNALKILALAIQLDNQDDPAANPDS